MMGAREMSDEVREEAAEVPRDGRDCPSCGAENAAYRRVCKYCRKPLVPGPGSVAERADRGEVAPFRALPVLGRSLAIIGGKIHVLLAVIIVGYSPALLYSWLEGSAMGDWGDEDRWIWTAMILLLLLSWVTSAFVITLTETWLRGDTVEIGKLARLGGRRVIRAVAVGVLFWLGLLGISFAVGLVGSCLGRSASSLLIWGISGILWCKWWVVTPVAVIEREGAIESFRRSSRLTEGNRWRILGLMLLFAIAISLGLMFWASSFQRLEGYLSTYFMVGVVFWWALVAVSISVMVTVGYVRLHGSHTVDLDNLVRVFD